MLERVRRRDGGGDGKIGGGEVEYVVGEKEERRGVDRL